MAAKKKSDINFDVIKDSYIGTLKKYFVFKGRARRREVWNLFFVNRVLGLIPGINAIVSLLTCIPSITVGVRRLHDTNRSGGWYFLGLTPLVGMIFLFVGIFVAGRRGILWILFILIFIASFAGIAVLIYWATQEGTAGKNKYGPNPKTRK
jgi:uncharacterized membrane protein YhaH (DUF805 family)